ncbi:hypothetical protein FRC20_011442 [Serendipita sp. 405]|nr:hypothetical protein FRC20_011442 [Serendipita sp. 405]
MMQAVPSTNAATGSSPRLPGPTEASPLLRARYSTGYDEPVPVPVSPSGFWMRYTSSNPGAHEPFRDMPAIMNFISLLPPPKDLKYEAMERVLPSGLSSNLDASTRKTSFILASLLWLYLHPTSTPIPGEGSSQRTLAGTWDVWKRLEDEIKGKRALLSIIQRVWGDFVKGSDGRSLGSVEEILWSEIPIEDDKSDTLRVVDLATAKDAPTWFLSHPLVMISLQTTWSRGIPQLEARESIWVAFDRLSTPRTTHAVFLAHHMIYLYNLSYLVLAAPSTPIYLYPTRSPSYREFYLLLYSLSAFPSNQIPTLSALPFAFVALALGLAYPGIPTPNTSTHSLLLLALSLFLLQLHLPNPVYIPTPLYLFDPKRTLPLATLVKGLLKQAVRPGLFFFGPIVILVGVVLAQALGDSFPILGALSGLLDELLQAHTTGDTEILSVGPSHPQTRITLLLLFISALGATFTLVNCLVMLFPGSVSTKGVLESRDEYEAISLDDEREGNTGHTVDVPSQHGRGDGRWRLGFQQTNTENRDGINVQRAVGHTTGGPWERYGLATATSAKRSFADVVRRYQHLRVVPAYLLTSRNTSLARNTLSRKPCGRVTIPPAFNVIVLLLGIIPATIIRSVTKSRRSSNLGDTEAGPGRTGHIETIPEERESAPSDAHLGTRTDNGDSNLAERWEGLVKRLVWRVSVGLPGLFIAGIWIWR